jgi:Tfp pilus assembly protein PilF
MQPTQTAAHLPGDLLDRLARGEVILAEVFGLDQDSLYKIANIGFGLLSSGKLAEAKQIYAGLVAADPYDSVFHCHLAAVHHRLRETEAAYREYSEALKFNCANVDALVGRGELQLERGEYKQALTDLRLAIETDPSRPSAKRARALLLAFERSKPSD